MSGFELLGPAPLQRLRVVGYKLDAAYPGTPGPEDVPPQGHQHARALPAEALLCDVEAFTCFQQTFKQNRVMVWDEWTVTAMPQSEQNPERVPVG